MTYELVRAKGMQERVIYSSFNHCSVMQIKELDPDAKTGFLCHDEIYDAASYAKGCGVTALHPNMTLIQIPGYVESCKQKGIRVHVWTVNSEEEVRHMKKLNVDAVITNYPDMALSVVKEEI